MTKSRFIYLGILAVAAAALIWDKTVNDVPWMGAAQATATAATDAAASADSVPTTPQAGWQLSPQVREVLDNLSRADGTGPTGWEETTVQRDLFAPTPAFASLIQVPDQGQPQKDIHRLAEQLHLSTILIGPGQDYVIINGEVVGEGDTIGPYEVVRIERETVVVQVENELIRLNVKDLR